MKNKFLIGLLVLSTAGLIFYSLSTGNSDEGYFNELTKERQEKDTFMKNSEQSPFGDERSTFSGLKYFEPDANFRVYAQLEPIKDKKVIILPTSTGEENRYLEYAFAAFEMGGVENRLLLLEVMDMGPTRGTLFLSFADETSTKETYGAGRYLDVKKIPAATSIELDFNKAYNPYCAYTDKFSCPLPPRENVLKIAIRAGEKSYDK